MSTQNYITPEEIYKFTIQAGVKKTKLAAVNMFILGILVWE